MKLIVQLLFGIFLSTPLFSQDFTGQWKGQFLDKSSSFAGWGGDRCDYVLEIECKGKNVTGFSYTYFTDGGKRYYTICKLKGTLNKASKYIEVIEIERTKTNVPVTIRNCFQIHKLTYFKQGDEQTLEGSWVPAPDQQGDCGFGTTVLSRRILQKSPSYITNSATKADKPKSTSPVAKSKPNQTAPAPVVKATPKKVSPQPDVKAKPKKPAPTVITKTDTINKSPGKSSSPEIVKTNIPANEIHELTVNKTEPAERKGADSKYEKRNTDLLKTIEIENETFTVDLYDNGEIDGDSISLFYNGKLVISKKRLNEKAITITLKVDDAMDINELIMYAENLGAIPPNTALMVVKDGDKRYETRISSDLKKSGVIRFIHRPKKKQ